MKLFPILLISSLALISCGKKETSEAASSKTVENVKPAQLIQINNSTEFETYFSKKDRLIVADLYADWCGPCKMIAPDFAALSGEYGDRADFLKINVDNNQEIAQRFNANSIPLILLIKNGNVLEQIVGAQSKEEYNRLILKNL